MIRRRTTLTFATIGALAVLLAGTHLFAQRGGGGGGRGGGGMAMMQPPVRLQALTLAFKLDKEQEKAAKALLDTAYKAAAPTRDGIVKAHAALGDIVAGDDRAGLDPALAAYVELATEMNDLEMTALAGVLRLVPEAQRPAPASDAAVAMMRGAFVGKKWNAVPGEKGY
jgi:hypothetical protein